MKNENKFLQIDYRLFELGLSSTEVLILAYIKSYNDNGKTFYASNKFIANQLGLTEKAVSRAIKTISKFKAITIKGAKGRNRSIQIKGEINALEVNEVSVPETKESTTEAIKTSNNTKLQDVRIPTEEEVDNQIENEVTTSKSEAEKLANKIFTDIDVTYEYDVIDIASKIIKIKDKYERDEMIKLVTNAYDSDYQTDSIEDIKELIK